MKLSRLKLGALLITAAALSCSDPLCGCSPMVPAAKISGRVTDAEGMPVAGALVRVRAGSAQCAEPFMPLGVDPPLTDNAGNYRSTLFHGSGVNPGECLEAWAEPPAGASALASERVRFTVSFHDASERSDSVRVDLQLRPIEQEMTMWVAPNDVACTGMYPTRCLLVREDPQAPWMYFYDSIEDFTWEPGFTYQLRVIRVTIRQPMADQGAYRYRLLHVLDKR